MQPHFWSKPGGGAALIQSSAFISVQYWTDMKTWEKQKNSGRKKVESKTKKSILRASKHFYGPRTCKQLQLEVVTRRVHSSGRSSCLLSLCQLCYFMEEGKPNNRMSKVQQACFKGCNQCWLGLTPGTSCQTYRTKNRSVLVLLVFSFVCLKE